MHWTWVALGYVSYLAAVSMSRQQFEKARRPLSLAAAAAWAILTAANLLGMRPWDPGIVLPLLVLLAGYWLSGLLFVCPDLRAERWLRSVDDALLTRPGVFAWFDRAPRGVTEYLELSYLLVYAAVPGGALMLAEAGHAAQLDRFWTIVLLSEFTCYGMLPWIQTRPPRVVEAADLQRRGTRPLRRLNLGLVERASIRVNTVPSGHAAGALATALAVGSSMPLAGGILLVLAVSIAVATVLGRYHYLLDSALGILVALAAWSLV
jgi:membrane-associated phospholipid phosphatase